MATDQKPQASRSSQPSAPQSPSVDTAPLEASIEAREQEQDNIDALQAQGDARPQLTAREQELEDELSALRSQLDEATKGFTVGKPKQYPAYKVPKGEEHLVHVRITKQGGEDLVEPVYKAFDPHQYRTSISKQAGFAADIVHKGKE